MQSEEGSPTVPAALFGVSPNKWGGRFHGILRRGDCGRRVGETPKPSGRRFFLAQTSLLAPYRPLQGMRVARASSGPKIPRRKRGRIYETGY